VADIYHWRRHPLPREHQVQGHLFLRGVLGGLTAILLLTALVAGLIGAALYGFVLVLTSLFS
jgi:hypothetical protein